MGKSFPVLRNRSCRHLFAGDSCESCPEVNGTTFLPYLAFQRPFVSDGGIFASSIIV